jgi:DNA-binding NarL/FixJ family response regulator
MTARPVHYDAPALGKVLLVDDELLVCKSLQADLQKRKLECDYCTSYDEAVKSLDAQDYHALITDIFISEGADGLDLIEKARMNGIPSVVITSALDLNVAKEGLNRGADQLFEKPFNADDLVHFLVDLWDSPKGMIGRRERLFATAQLTPKEREVGRLILKGLSNQEIADVTGSTVATVKFYGSQIYEKCGVKSRSELFNLAFPT